MFAWRQLLALSFDWSTLQHLSQVRRQQLSTSWKLPSQLYQQTIEKRRSFFFGRLGASTNSSIAPNETNPNVRSSTNWLNCTLRPPYCDEVSPAFSESDIFLAIPSVTSYCRLRSALSFFYLAFSAALLRVVIATRFQASVQLNAQPQFRQSQLLLPIIGCLR